jgi:putative membrane protein insertion efficiency factor
MKKLFRYIFICPILFYRYFISPLYPPCCRFVPSCSEYAVEAFKKHNFIKASWLVFIRIMRCQPLGKAGLDQIEKNHPK